MWNFLFLAVALNIIVYTSCNPGSTHNTTSNDGDDDDTNDCSGALYPAIQSITKFTFQFLNELMESTTNNTLSSSPVETWFLTAQLGLYAYGNTLKEILKFLGLKSKDEIRCVMKLINSYAENLPERVEFKYSLNIVADIENKFTNSFKQDMIEYVQGRARNYDKRYPCRAAKMINADIAKDTNNRVREAIPSSKNISNILSSIGFVTGVYFKSDWEYEFDTNSITLYHFHDISNKVILIPYVHQEQIYNYTYCPKLDAQIVEIPYKSRIFTCVIVKPNKRGEIRRLAQKLALQPGLFDIAYKKLKPTFLKLGLPLYQTHTSGDDATVILKKKGGVPSIFDEQKSQLKNINENNKIPVVVSGGRLETVIETVLSGEKQSNVDDFSKVPENLKEVDFVADGPVILIILIKGVPLFIRIPNVIKVY